MPELAEALMKARGVEADTSSLSRVLQGGLLKKKR